jgi:hypothetical protein
VSPAWAGSRLAQSPQQDAHRSCIGGMRVSRSQDHPPQLRQIEPQRELAAQYAAGFPGAPAGDDLDAAHALGPRGVEEIRQRMKRALRRAPVQIECSHRGKLAAAKTLPRRSIHASRMNPDRDRDDVGDGAAGYRCSGRTWVRRPRRRASRGFRRRRIAAVQRPHQSGVLRPLGAIRLGQFVTSYDTSQGTPPTPVRRGTPPRRGALPDRPRPAPRAAAGDRARPIPMSARCRPSGTAR